jgi:hypothetical protein
VLPLYTLGISHLHFLDILPPALPFTHPIRKIRYWGMKVAFPWKVGLLRLFHRPPVCPLSQILSYPVSKSSAHFSFRECLRIKVLWKQCSGSVPSRCGTEPDPWIRTLYYGFGSRSCSGPDPALFFSGFQDANKKWCFLDFLKILPNAGTFTPVFKLKR